MIESVLEQTYPNMELCLADGSDTDEILYLWRSHTASVSKNSNTSSYVADAAKRAVLEHLIQQGLVATMQSSPLQTTAFKINYEFIGNPMVLIAIRYNGLVKNVRCIDAIVKRSLYENYELAVWNVSCHTQEEYEENSSTIR